MTNSSNYVHHFVTCVIVGVVMWSVIGITIFVAIITPPSLSSIFQPSHYESNSFYGVSAYVTTPRLISQQHPQQHRHCFTHTTTTTTKSLSKNVHCYNNNNPQQKRIHKQNHPLFFHKTIHSCTDPVATSLIGGSSSFSSSSSRRTSSSSSSTQLYGIPKMFRWLTDQYPDILNRQLTEQGIQDDLIVHNFYLDMNGIIHPCTHDNNSGNNGNPILLDETAMFKRIFLYVDRLYKLVKPTKVLYLAVDGVAPRAKMNQQRSRRFRSAKEAEIAGVEYAARLNYGNNGPPPPPPSQSLNGAKRFDSNCITPGTDFMLKLCVAMQKWVEYKQKTDPFWIANKAIIIISGSDVPGEGEHKVMDFIRETREYYYKSKEEEGINDDPIQQQYYQPFYTHVLYGLDADLIMLGLVTHEPNFMLLREKMSVVMAGKGRSKYKKKKDMLEYDQNDFEILQLSLLRRMLSIQFRKFADSNTDNNNINNKRISSATVDDSNNNNDNNSGGTSSSSSTSTSQLKYEEYQLNRVIDDFVFMCMLVGNDFLPHIPHLEIDSGALSLMMSTYIDLLASWGGYLTKKEKIHPQRLEQFLYELAIYEEEHFKRRGYDENEIGWQLSTDYENEKDDFYGTYYKGSTTPKVAMLANRKQTEKGTETEENVAELLSMNADSTNQRKMVPTGNRSFRRKYPDNFSRSYRDFYYETKLGWTTQQRDYTLYKRREHVREYLEGLHWNLNYYHNGCQSWNWFFPYFYAPLATDMVNLHELYDNIHNIDEDGYGTIDFDLGEPFPSLAQLLAVLPPQSSELLPNPLAELMHMELSPIRSYYPMDFSSDPNGKRQSWEAIVQVPFIDGDLLLTTVQQILNQDEQLRMRQQQQQEQEQQSVEDNDGVLGNTIKGGGGLLTPPERRRNVPGVVHTFVPMDFVTNTIKEEDPSNSRSSSTTTTLPTAATTTGNKGGIAQGTLMKKKSKLDVTATSTETATSSSSEQRTILKRTTKGSTSGVSTDTSTKGTAAIPSNNETKDSTITTKQSKKKKKTSSVATTTTATNDSGSSSTKKKTVKKSAPKSSKTKVITEPIIAATTSIDGEN